MVPSINIETKILIIDDEKSFVQTAQDRLEFEGYTVISAEDGLEGLKKAHSEKPDIILLDVMMPKINGYQACRELKLSNDTKNIPVVLLTAKTQESDKHWGHAAGAEAYFIKPFEMEDLLDKIRELVK